MHPFTNRRVALVAVALTLVTLEIRSPEAHKAITSPYDYNKDTFPILRDRCGRCHVDGGPGPMALLKYNDGPDSAVPWAESIREVLISQQMPPWYVDPIGPSMRGGNPLTAREADKLITWAAGGQPEGDPAKKPAASHYREGKAGPPDLKITMDSDHTVPEAAADETVDFVLPTGLTEARWVKAVDVIPGAPQVVRNAVVSVENGPVLAVWVPGDDLVSAPSGAAFKLPAGAKLHLQVHYKKQWQLEGKSVVDRSAIGLYFTDPPATGREIQSLIVEPTGAAATGEMPQTQAFSGMLASAARVVALRPSLDKVYGTFDVHAITPSGTRVPLLLLRAPRPEWRRRYWMAEPVELPAGSRVEVTVTPPPEFMDFSAARLVKGYQLQLALDFVPQS